MRNRIPTRPAVNAQAPLHVENLESRDTPTGNVSVFVSGTELLVIGDGNLSGNQIEVTGDASGNVVVTGRDGTTINGGASSFSIRPPTAGSMSNSLEMEPILPA